MLGNAVEGLKRALRQILHSLGADIVRFPDHHPASRRVKLLCYYGIDVVFDVGANAGQYARELRQHGYRGRIVSFEPLSSVYGILSSRARNDHDWIAIQSALGSERSFRRINIAANSQSSSLLNMLPAHESAETSSRYVGAETVSVVTLDSVFEEHCIDRCRPFLKIDTQGYEREVLAGAEISMTRLFGIQLEMSLVELYAGCMMYREATETILNAGFALMGIEPGFADPSTGRLLQYDGLFFRPLS